MTAFADVDDGGRGGAARARTTSSPSPSRPTRPSRSRSRRPRSTSGSSTARACSSSGSSSKRNSASSSAARRGCRRSIGSPWASRRPRRRSSSSARAAPARSSSRARSTSTARARDRPFVARQLRGHPRDPRRERALRAHARRVHRRRSDRAGLFEAPTGARSSSTRSAICRSRAGEAAPRACRRARSSGSAPTSRASVDVRVIAATNVDLEASASPRARSAKTSSTA